MAIGLFLTNAVSIARREKKLNLALFSKVLLECPDLPGVGAISGSLDYVTSIVKHTKRAVCNVKFPKHGPPYFLVIEAKTASPLGREGSRGQLIAQLLTLQYHDP
jgi:hypothetical protein